MKIKTKNPKGVSMKLCVPIDGTITVGADGIVDVSPKCAVALVNGTNDWEYVKSVKEAEKTSIEDTNPDEDSEKNEKEEFEAGLKNMSLAEMKELATEAEYPVEEWEKITTKKLMSGYLLSKFDGVK